MIGRGGGGGRRSKLPRSATPIHDRNTHRPPVFDASSSRSSGLIDGDSQFASLIFVNDFLASHSPLPHLTLKTSPSARDINQILRFVLSQLGLPIIDLEFELPLLSGLGCPLKLSKSILRDPGNPHDWPLLLSTIHWLVQLAINVPSISSAPNNILADHRSSTTSTPKAILSYVINSYNVRADGDAVDALDDEFRLEMQHRVDAANAVLAQEAANLEAKLHSLTTTPSRAQALERERDILVKELKKLETAGEVWQPKGAVMEARLVEREMELEKKEGELRRLRADNEELKTSVDVQGTSVRDAERMRREIWMIERDIAEAECVRNAAEDKARELDAAVGRKFKETEAMAVQCNQALRKLKLGNDFEFVPNAKGSSPAEVMGIDYKTTLKPVLNKMFDDANKICISKREELMNLQNKSLEVAAVLEVKQKSLATLQAKCEEDCEQRLQDAVRESEDNTQLCASDLLAVIDAVSEFKHPMKSTIREMQKDPEETFVSSATEVLKRAHSSPPAEPSSSAPNLIGGLKRACWSPPTGPS